MQSTLRLSSACLLCGLMLACSGNSSGTLVTDAQTLIAVDPTDFPSGVAPTGSATSVPACGSPMGSGAYVAELIDVSRVLDLDTLQPIPDFPVQSSPPTPCNRSVGFGSVVNKRQYVVRVSTYADTDGNPSTIDICTLEGTSVAVTRDNDECTTTLASPLSRSTCYGWQKSAAPAGAGSSASQDESACVGTGCPGIALEYQTRILHHCVADVD